MRAARRRLLRTVLREWGYWQSLRANTAVDKEGHPLPWYTYPAIHYLDALDFSSHAVLEWGSGSSTLYWATRTRSVLSIEHDPAWAGRTAALVTSLPVEMVLATERERYVSAPLEQRHPRFGLIIIDGIHRPACARVAVEKLAPGGLLVFDNSNWFPQACAWLRSRDLIQVDFHGLCPMTWVGSTTSMFLTRDFVPAPRDGTLPALAPAGLRRSYDRHPLFGDPDGP